MCQVTVRGKNVLVDGVQVGSTYSSHETAIHQGKKIHEKHYPSAKFEIIPETPPVPETQRVRTKKQFTIPNRYCEIRLI